MHSFKALERRGSAVVVVLMVMIGIVVAGAAFVRVTGGMTSRLARDAEDDRARHLAEAGVREGIEAIRQGQSGAVGDMGAPAYLGGGVLWVEATELLDGNVRLLSTAMVGSGRAAVAAVVKGELAQLPLFSATLSSKDKLTLNAGVMIDSYDSTLGGYGLQAVNTKDGFVYANAKGDVKSNADIELNASAHVFGDANPGPGYAVTMGTGAYVEGSTASSPELLEFPPIEVPSVDQSASLILPPLSGTSIGPGILGYDTLGIEKEATLTITGPATLVVNDFAGYKDANLVVDATAGPVTIYVVDSYFHDSGFEADAAFGSPMSLAFLIAAEQDVTFPSKAKVRGAYYAPDADMTFTSANEAWGSFVAKRVSMSSDMSFHYDENLAKYWEADGGSGDDEVVVWLHAAVTPSRLRADRRDPELVLGVKKSALPSPADAWKP